MKNLLSVAHPCIELCTDYLPPSTTDHMGRHGGLSLSGGGGDAAVCMQPLTIDYLHCLGHAIDI